MLQVIVQARQRIIEDPYVILNDVDDLSPAAKTVLRSLQEVWPPCQPTCCSNIWHATTSATTSTLGHPSL